jgi:stearoyl-CoA desaturase (Delta-9 desaturase)
MMAIRDFLANANWFVVYYTIIVHVGAAFGLKRALFDVQWATLGWMLVFYYLGGLGITAGAHRLWAHRSYKAHGSVRFFLMLCTAIANQGTIFHWVRDHRVHHKYSDTPSDPHDSGRGFFFAHMGWLLVKKDPRVIQAGKKLNYDDLWADWTVRLQEKLSPWGNVFMAFFFTTFVTMYMANETYWNAMLVCGFLRYVLTLHATWLVNSAAHFYGYRPYDESIPPSENWFVSVFAIGEGWHNWHHKFPYDYAASEFGISKQFNPTKLTIDFFAMLGLITERKRAVPIWEKMKAARSSKVAAAEKIVDPDADDPVRAFAELKAKAM